MHCWHIVDALLAHRTYLSPTHSLPVARAASYGVRKCRSGVWGFFTLSSKYWSDAWQHIITREVTVVGWIFLHPFLFPQCHFTLQSPRFMVDSFSSLLFWLLCMILISVIEVLIGFNLVLWLNLMIYFVCIRSLFFIFLVLY